MSTHLKKYFWEECARLMLLNFYESEFLNLENGDRPDLSNALWGIEVTEALTTEEGRIRNLSSNVMGKSYHDISCQEHRKLKEYNIKTHELDGKVAGFIWPPQFINDEKITNSFIKKIELLNNGNYSLKKYYGLFIFAPMECFGKNEVTHMMDKFNKLQEEYELKFSRVFISCMFTRFGNCNLTTETCLHVDLRQYAKILTDIIIPQSEEYCHIRDSR